MEKYIKEEEKIILGQECKQKDISYMQIALDLAKIGLKIGEVPVGCIFLHKPSGKILAKSHNTTNKSNCVFLCFFGYIVKVYKSLRNIVYNAN